MSQRIYLALLTPRYDRAVQAGVGRVQPREAHAPHRRECVHGVPVLRPPHTERRRGRVRREQCEAKRRAPKRVQPRSSTSPQIAPGYAGCEHA